MNDQDYRCAECKQLITIPPFGLGECSIHEVAHKQKEYCPDWALLERENAYCAPTCSLNGRLVRERGGKVTEAPDPRPIRDFPLGTAVKRELDVDEAVTGAPTYFVEGWPSGQFVNVIVLDPRTRNRSEQVLLGSVRVYPI